MNGYWIFAFGLIVGGAVVALLAGLCKSAHDGDHSQKVTQAYWDGFNMGQGEPGRVTLGTGVCGPPLTQKQINDWQGWPADREGG
jgi:hypothetical protein